MIFLYDSRFCKVKKYLYFLKNYEFYKKIVNKIFVSIFLLDVSCKLEPNWMVISMAIKIQVK